MLKTVCLLAVIAAATAATLPDVALTAVDPIDMVGISGSKIFFKAQSTTGVTFGGYVDFCQRNGFRTASIRNGGEHAVIRDYVMTNNFGWNMWIGGWDINHEGTFTWLETADEFTYADWGRPNDGNFPIYNCVFIASRTGGAKFYTAPCGSVDHFVPLCEAKLS